MQKYKDMTYTVRKDGRLMKKVSFNNKPTYLYSNEPSDLYKQYIDLKYKNNNGITVENNSITFRKYAEKWFEINCTTKEIATQDSIKNRIRHLNKYIGNIKLKSLKPYHIQEIVTGMVKEGYTDLTKRTLAECKRILNDAVINDVISRNVAIGITTPKFSKNERTPLTQLEDSKILEIAFNNKYGLFILLLRYCGLRPEEAVALTVNDIDIINKKIIINKATSLARNQPKEKPTKNLKNRKVPIPTFLLDLLKERLAYCDENQIQYIFTKETDKHSRLTKQALKSHLETFLNDLNKGKSNFKNLKKQLRKLQLEGKTEIEISTKRIAGLNYKTDKKNVKLEINYLQNLIKNYEDNELITFTYYQLRHSYCTMLYYAGVKIKKAQELMGHSSADMVYNIYTHLDEERENADELINDYISNNITKSCQSSCQV